MRLEISNEELGIGGGRGYGTDFNGVVGTIGRAM